MHLPTTLLALPLAAAAALPAAAATPLCAAGPGDCTLREAAAGAGVRIGVALDRNVIEGDRPGAALAAQEFDSLTAENQMKWGVLSAAEGVYDFAAADAVVGFAESHGQRVRGHTLLWGRGSGPPKWWSAALAVAPDPATRAGELVDAHIATVVRRYAGRIESWDVVNEPFALFGDALDPENPFQQALGGDYIARAFRAAHAADPAARLFLNEVLLEVADAKLEATLALAEGLLNDGVPIHGIGFQGHFFVAPPNETDLRARLQRVADLGLDVEITELDIPIRLFNEAPDPDAGQGEAYAAVMRACLAVATCTGVTTWGLEDGDAPLDGSALWKGFAPNRPHLFDDALAPKAAYFAVRDTLLTVPEPANGSGVAIGLLALAARLRRRTLAQAPGVARGSGRERRWNARAPGGRA